MDNRVAAVLCAKETKKSLIKKYSRVSRLTTEKKNHFFWEDVRNLIKVFTQLPPLLTDGC